MTIAAEAGIDAAKARKSPSRKLRWYAGWSGTPAIIQQKSRRVSSQMLNGILREVASNLLPENEKFVSSRLFILKPGPQTAEHAKYAKRKEAEAQCSPVMRIRLRSQSVQLRTVRADFLNRSQ